MRYEEYEKKIIKKRKVWKFFFRFRVPLIITGVTIALVSGSLVGTKGVVIDKKTVYPTYIYGEGYEYESVSFLSDMAYEFAPIDSNEWTSTSPIRVGQYKMRSKSSNLFGSYYYGEVRTFEILPKEIDVEVMESSVTYGETPTIALELPFDDQLVDGYTFNIDGDLTTDKWNYTPDIGSLTIHDASGADVTNCYTLNVKPKDVDILPRTIAISTGSTSKIYDGAVLENQDFNITSGSLVPGDSIALISSPSIINVGSTTNEHAYHITNQDGFDMTSHYFIEQSSGSLVIEKRPITFKSEDYKYTYDGEKHIFSLDDVKYSVEQLTNNQQVELAYANQADFLKVGKYTNSFSAKILDNGVDVSSNYDITYSFGETTIEKRSIKLRSGSDKVIYDASKHSYSEFEIVDGSLAEKDEVEIVVNEYVDAGEYENKATFSIVDKQTKQDYTDCYDKGEEYGTLTVEKVDLVIKVESSTVTYDGLPHKNEYSLKEGELVGEDYIEVVKNEEYTNAGVYDKDEFEVTVKTKDKVDNTKNYNIKYENTKEALTIKEREISVSTLSKDKKYDGKSIISTLPEDSVPYKITEGTLAEGEYIDFKYTNDLTAAGKETIGSEISVYHQTGDEPDIEKDTKVSTNYKINVDSGSFEVQKRDITIETLDFEHVYDRVTTIPTDKKVFQIAEGGDGLLEGHELKALSVTCDKEDVGEWDYKIDKASLKIEDDKSNDVTANYNVTWVNTGKVTITKRDVELTIAGKKKVYDGTPLTCDAYTQEGLLDGDKFTFEKLPSVTHVWEGKVENRPEKYDITKSDGTPVTKNYNVTIKKIGDLQIEQRKITLESPTLKKTYDGKAFSQTDPVTVTNNSLASGDTIEVVSMLSKDNTYIHVKDAEKVKNTFEVKIKNSEGLNVTDDYEITKKYGTITIDPREISLRSNSIEKVFDGQLASKDYSVDLSNGTLAEGDKMTINSINSRDNNYVHVCEEDNTYTISLNNGAGEDVISDYKITYDYGTIKITPCKITLSVFETYIVYDGTDHIFSYYEGNVGSGSGMIYISYGSLPGDFSLAATISVNASEMINAGTYQYTYDYAFSTSSPYGYEASDFNVTLTGKQEISTCVIVIQTLSGNKVYDGEPFGNGMSAEELFWISSGSLAGGDYISTYVLSSGTEVGSYVHMITGIVILNANGDDVTSNYSIYYLYGSVIIDEA